MQFYDANHDYQAEFIDRWNDGIRGTKTQMIALSVLMFLAGGAAVLAPFGLYAFFQVMAAIALVAYGGMQVAGHLRTPEMFRSPALLVSGVLNVLLGGMLFVLPATFMAASVGFLLAFLLIAFGVERISFARRMRYFGMPDTTPAMLVGALNIALGIAFVFAPMVAGMALSYLLAAYLLIGGVGLMVEALSLKRIEHTE